MFSLPRLRERRPEAIKAVSKAREKLYLDELISSAKIDSGSVFRAIDRWGNVSRRALDPKAVNDIVKRRATLAGLNAGDFSAHGLRSGYLTEAANRGIPLPEAMEQSRHRSVQQASSYYNDAELKNGRAARLFV